MSQLELVVFDIAGTTVNDEDGVGRALRGALQDVGISVTLEASNAVMGLPKPIAIRQLIVQVDPDSQQLHQIDQIHRDFETRMIRFYQSDPSVVEIEGAAEFFGRLRAQGIKVGLNTGFSRIITDVILRRLGWGIGEVIDAVVSSDEVERGRPDPAMIQRLAAELGVSDPAKIAKVGDTPADLQEGTNAGCRFIIGVCSGTHRRDELLSEPHTHLVDSIRDLPPLFLVP